MKYTTYLFIVLFVTFGFIAGAVVVNYTVDPYGVFKRNFDNQRIEPNQHFIKMRYILNNPTKYESFIFGSSRVGNIDISKIPNEKFYNMTYSEGLPKEFLNDIKLMIARGVSIKTLLIGLDEFSFRVDPDKHAQQPMRMPYPDNLIKFYTAYLLKAPDYTIIKSSLLDKPSNYFDIFNSGRPLHPQADDNIESNIDAHLNDSKFNIPSGYRGNRMQETLDELKEIKQIADENNIKVVFFINPIHKTTYNDTNLTEFGQFKEELAHISSYYDFSGINTITSNNYYYYETSHYRPVVGDMIIAKLFSAKTVIVPEDFGIEVKLK